MQRGLKNQRSWSQELTCFLTSISLNLTREILIYYEDNVEVIGEMSV